MPDKSERCKFEQVMKGLAMRPLQQQGGFTSKTLNKKIENVNDINASFKADFRSNMSSFEEVSFETGQGMASFGTTASQVVIEFGIGALKEGTLTMTTHMGNRADEPVPVAMHYAASAAWLSENTLYIRVHLLDTCVGSIHIQAVFGDSDVTIFFRKQEETLFGEFSGHFYGTRQSDTDKHFTDARPS